MKRCISKAVLLAAITLPALSNASWAQRSDDFGCSNATLKGEYAFGVTNYTPPGLPNGPPEVVTGIRFYDGKGHFTQRDYLGNSIPEISAKILLEVCNLGNDQDRALIQTATYRQQVAKAVVRGLLAYYEQGGAPPAAQVAASSK